MDQKEYERLTKACDFVLDKFSSNYAIMAIPWLHVLNGHPNSLYKYQHVFAKRSILSAAKVLLYNISYILYKLSGSFFEFRISKIKDQPSRQTDILFISHFVNVKVQKNSPDFYYGELPAHLEKSKGIRTAIGMIDHTPKNKTGAERAKIEEDELWKFLFPKTLSFGKEISLIIQCISSFYHLLKAYYSEKGFDKKAILREAVFQSISPETFKELRIYKNVQFLIEHLKPAVLIITWEGWAWERLSIHAAKFGNPEIKCLGYQHTVLYASSHSVKKSLGQLYDPDMIFTIGNVTAGILRSANEFTHTSIISYGSQRLVKRPKEQINKIRTINCLVAPEGIESECLLLFTFAIESAKKMPDVNFIFRTHPVLPFTMLSEKNTSLASLPSNCVVSDLKDINADFERCNFILYRGSSVALYAVLNGLRPVYYSLPAELSIDPLYLLDNWRLTVKDTEDFEKVIQADTVLQDAEKQKQYSSARSFCKDYVSVPDEAVLYDFIPSKN